MKPKEVAGSQNTSLRGVVGRCCNIISHGKKLLYWCQLVSDMC